MIRHMLKLAVEAVKVEAKRILSPEETRPAEEPTPAPPKVEAAPKVPSKWSSSAYHVETLASATCPDCAGTKKVGAYRCLPCHEKAAALCSEEFSKGRGT